MSRLIHRRILVGVTGGIAAYKSAELIRLLKREGAEVRVVMTAAAAEFITPLTLQALSGQPVRTSLLDANAEAGMDHIELAKWADRILIAPASADFIARIAGGFGNDLLSTLCLATEAPLLIAPAMNQAMWHDAATVHNIDKLSKMNKKQVQWLGPDAGEQACGDVGVGRMLEPQQLANRLIHSFDQGLLAHQRILITAGPTLEPIDPVRYISNHSSGKMGFALAQAASDLGASVHLVAGPVALPTPDRVIRQNVQTAAEMQQICLEHCAKTDIFIASAAVCDYQPVTVAQQKLKKPKNLHQHPDSTDSKDTWLLELKQTPDILASVSLHPQRPFCVGFAAETHNVIDFARQKLHQKQLDLVVANDISQPGIGFGSDNNSATLMWPKDKAMIYEETVNQEHIAKTRKITLAHRILERVAALHCLTH